MKVNLSVLDIDMDTEYHSYEVLLFNVYSFTSKSERTLLRFKYSVVGGFELDLFGFRLIK